MAGPALQPVMRADQIEPGLAVVVKAPEGPAIGIVTGCAIGPQRPVMGIIRRMTAPAFRRRGQECRVQMARFARGQNMQPDQREPGNVMVERHRHPPAIRLVARITIPPQLSLVRVVVSVAPETVGRHFRGRVRIQVTFVARNFCVLPAQREIGVDVMVETNPGPPVRAVTGFAFRPQASAMHILDAMTPDTGFRQSGINLAFVTGRTGQLVMLSGQTERCCVMVEPPDRTPGGFRVTIGTGFAQTALVRFIVPVAINTAPRRLPEQGRLRVTPRTGGQTVRPAQGEIGHGMVKGFPVEPDDIAIASDMVGVAMATFLRGHFFGFSVEPGPCSNIRRDILVTPRTQRRLRPLGEGHVAIVAFFFQLLMPFDQIAGHDESFKQALRTCRST